MNNSFSRYWKIIIPIIVIILAVAAYFIYMGKSTSSSGTELISFTDNYRFAVPEGYNVDNNTIAGTIVLTPDHIEQFNAQDYIDLLEKDAIIIKPFPTVNQDNEIFEAYVNQKYADTDQATFEISYEQVGDYEVATVKPSYETDEYKDVNEYIKIVNTVNPVIISSSGPSEALNSVVNSINDINDDKQSQAIVQQIKAIGSLIKAGMNNQIHSLFTSEYQDSITKSDLQTIFTQSLSMLQRQITFSNGILDNENNTFEFVIIFIDPDNPADYRFGKFELQKESGDWLISKFDLPKDDNSQESTGDATDVLNLNQEEINKVIQENSQ